MGGRVLAGAGADGAALAEQQIEERADGPEDPDDDEPEYFLCQGEIVGENQNRRQDVADDGNEQEDQGKASHLQDAMPSSVACHVKRLLVHS